MSDATLLDEDDGLRPLTTYGVDPRTGFVPSVDPLDHLPIAFDAWEETAAQLAPLIRSRRIRGRLGELPPIEVEGLDDPRQLERALLIGCIFANAWVWGGEQPDLRLPANVAQPLCRLALRLDRPPIVHYASMALNNWRRVDLEAPLSADNMRMQLQLLGGVDEDWFFIASLGVELAAAPVVAAAHRAVQASIDADAPALARALEVIADGMAPVLAALERVREWCDPHTYYLRVRPFFSGWPDPGLVYEGADAEPVKYIGGSAGQSSVIQALDAALGVSHERPETSAYLRELRRYMPVGHRRLVEDAERLSRVRAMAAADAEVRGAYNAAVEQLDLFRRRHIGLAHDFIAKPSGMTDATGTGGTSFVDFLREARIGAARSKI